MRALILIASLAAVLAYGFIASAQAVQCTTTCGGRNADGSQQCWTNCSR